MDKIKDILTINLEEEIKGVIDLSSQKDDEILSELDGFILTESLSKHFNDFCEEYVSGSMQSGVWLSGFYGSGKSYFAKMLGFLLKNPILNGTAIRQRFLPKLAGLPDADIIENNLLSLNRINSHVVLFDSAKSTATYGLTYMLFANFLRSLGLLDNWIGILEYNLLLDGRYDELLSTIRSNEGIDWFELRHNMMKNHVAFKKAIISMGATEREYEESKNLAEQRRKEYDSTKLHEDLQRYLNFKPDTRIVFMIDEVSEAINQDKINLLDLEGVAESLASLGRKVWTIAIAQLKLDDVISMKNLSKSLLTKLRDRFRTTIDIKADEVDVIIKQRLLAKHDAARQELMKYYQSNSGAIRDITNIHGLNLRPTADAETYADYYPFHEYQFRMLQYFLFGSSQMVQTKVGTRGMIISAFDVLKKEVKRDFHEHAHVTATQLCNQAELNAEEAQRVRYEQAANALKDKGYKFVEGKKLLQTIHFLAKTEVTQTTAENICRAYVDCPENYYDVLEEIKSALSLLTENRIVLLTGNQYRITNQTEMRILDDMKNYDVPPYIIRGEITKTLKGMQMFRGIQSLTVETVPVSFLISREDGEPILGNSSDILKVLLHDISVVHEHGDRTRYINDLKVASQQNKECVYLVPDVQNANDISELVTEIKRIEYIGDKSYSTDEEKRIVHSFTNELDNKKNKLVDLLQISYAQATAVYQYNIYELTQATFDSTLKQIQRRIYDNIYTKRLSARLLETVATKVLTENTSRLHSLFGAADDFKFFDTSGNFIGNNLSVTTEILAKASTFISGSDLEKQLAAPPTGYSFGTVMTSVAALFRGNKLIAKYNGNDYNSANTEGSREIFSNSRNFSRASFKAVSQNLSYKDRNDIIDILKDDCEYKYWTSENLSYQLNDFDVVDAVRNLSKAVLSRINREIESDTRLSRLFAGSLQAKAVFQQFTPTVTEGNCLSQAQTFLSQQDDFIAAVERVKKDLNFINNNLRRIERIKGYIEEVKEELSASNCDMQTILSIVSQFQQCYETDVVSNFQKIQDLEQKTRDHYYTLFNEKAKGVTKLYTELYDKAEELKTQLDNYPKDWNSRLYQALDQFEKNCQRYQVKEIVIPQYEIRCSKCGHQLRDLVYAEHMASQHDQKLQIWETEVIKTKPEPQLPTKPKTRNMRSYMPSGKLSVSQYRQWLTNQLSLLQKFDSADELDFNN